MSVATNSLCHFRVWPRKSPIPEKVMNIAHGVM